MNEEETINILEDMLEKAGKLYEEEFCTLVEDKHMWAVRGLLDLYKQEKEKNKKLEEEYAKAIESEADIAVGSHKLINNLAQAIRFMSTNEKLTVEDIIKEFSKENKVTDDFMERWEKSQHEESNLKDKVIDMIVSDYIQDYLYDERSDYPCEFFYDEIKKKDGCKQKSDGCKECLKEYYFNKVKENEK